MGLLHGWEFCCYNVIEILVNLVVLTNSGAAALRRLRGEAAPGYSAGKV